MSIHYDIARCTAMQQNGKPIAPCTTCARHVQAHPHGSNTPWMTIPPAFWNSERYVCSYHLETRHAAP